MESTEKEDSVILIEDEAESSLGSCILLAEDAEESPLKEENTEEAVDEEVIVTFCKRPKVMPHARYDCPTHPFEQMECETSYPLGRNAETCSECYCYICDKVAAECKDWVTPSFCHCNAHNKSKFWKDQWNAALTGSLSEFNLELSEIDTDVQHGASAEQRPVQNNRMLVWHLDAYYSQNCATQSSGYEASTTTDLHHQRAGRLNIMHCPERLRLGPTRALMHLAPPGFPLTQQPLPHFWTQTSLRNLYQSIKQPLMGAIEQVKATVGHMRRRLANGARSSRWHSSSESSSEFSPINHKRAKRKATDEAFGKVAKQKYTRQGQEE